MTDISANQLSGEASVYLRQHAENPVHWQPWGKKALEEAQRLNRPILLSIGYAACHWCHVMAHESFEDSEVAAVMNALFVNIKVDREERPDIDQIYMAALGAMGQQGGWPLTMFLRPDGKPFWGGTYFPRRASYNLPGFIDVLHAVHNLWQNDKLKINHNAEAIFTHLEDKFAAPSSTRQNETAFFDQVSTHIASSFDPVNGGMKGAPKFPNAPLMDMLWLSWLYTGNSDNRDSFTLSLKTMLQGGIYDHIGGGLCRYSTDTDWLVPHFEKMLYDNAQLIRHANYAYAQTRDELFRIRIEETVDWLIREMRLFDGSFASSLDADSEGEEGKFYLWQENEIEEALGVDAGTFKEFYGISKDGNWDGKNILNRLHAIDCSAVPASIQAAKTKLFDEREKRTRPARDEKALTDWNGLVIRALAEAGRNLVRPEWITHAEKAYRSTKASFRDGEIAHCRMGESFAYPALSSDYASMINAALSLYEATRKTHYIDDAVQFKLALDMHHKDESGDYRLSARNADDVILHAYGDYDEAIPSATSQIMEALTRLFLATGDMDLYQSNEAMIERALGRVSKQQYGQVGILNAARFAAEPLSLVIASEDATDALVSVARNNPDPRRLDKIIAFKPDTIIALPTGGSVQTTEPCAWLCKGHICLPPVKNAEALQILLTGKN